MLEEGLPPLLLPKTTKDELYLDTDTYSGWMQSSVEGDTAPVAQEELDDLAAYELKIDSVIEIFRREVENDRRGAFVNLEDMARSSGFEGMRRIIGITYPQGTKLCKYSPKPLLQKPFAALVCVVWRAACVTHARTHTSFVFAGQHFDINGLSFVALPPLLVATDVPGEPQLKRAPDGTIETTYSCQLTTSSGEIEAYMGETDSEDEGCDDDAEPHHADAMHLDDTLGCGPPVPPHVGIIVDGNAGGQPGGEVTIVGTDTEGATSGFCGTDEGIFSETHCTQSLAGEDDAWGSSVFYDSDDSGMESQASSLEDSFSSASSIASEISLGSQGWSLEDDSDSIKDYVASATPGAAHFALQASILAEPFSCDGSFGVMAPPSRCQDQWVRRQLENPHYTPELADLETQMPMSCRRLQFDHTA